MNDTSSTDDLREVAGYYVTGTEKSAGKPRDRGWVVACIPAGSGHPLSIYRLTEAVSKAAGDSAFIILPDAGEPEAVLFTRDSGKMQLSYTPGDGKIKELAKTLEFLLVGFGFSKYDRKLCEPDIVITTLSPGNETDFFKAYAAARYFTGDKATGIIINDGETGDSSEDLYDSVAGYLADHLDASMRILGRLGNDSQKDPTATYAEIAGGILDLTGRTARDTPNRSGKVKEVSNRAKGSD